jgi:GT2 family glycosyltransferase
MHFLDYRPFLEWIYLSVRFDLNSGNIQLQQLSLPFATSSESPHGSEVRTTSVIIPARNAERELAACLRSVRSSVGIQPEIIVVDDDSRDCTSVMAGEFEVDHLLRLARQSGPAIARNAGARLASGQILIFLDADVILKPDTISRLADAIHSGRWTAVFGSYCDQPTAPGLVSQFRNLLHHFTHQSSQPEAGTFWSGCGAVHRDVFWSVGGFLEQYSDPSIEDIEFGMRLRDQGHKIRLDAGIMVTHQKRWTLFATIQTDIFRRGIPWTRLLMSRGRIPNDLNLRWSQRLSVVATAILLAAMLLQTLADHTAFVLPAILGGSLCLAEATAAAGSLHAACLMMIFALLLLQILAATLWPLTGLAILLSTLMIAGLNRNLLATLARLRGKCFAVACVPLLVNYFACCGVSFAAGVLLHGIRKGHQT